MGGTKKGGRVEQNLMDGQRGGRPPPPGYGPASIQKCSGGELQTGHRHTCQLWEMSDREIFSGGAKHECATDHRPL